MLQGYYTESVSCSLLDWGFSSSSSYYYYYYYCTTTECHLWYIHVKTKVVMVGMFQSPQQHFESLFSLT